VENPRKELEDHYYNPTHSGLLELGLKPHFMTEEVLVEMLKIVSRHGDRIDEKRVLPRVKWRS
ncbi:MAG: NAD-dependent dehydratase, partial [Deltaproteobacteria bacterium]|nr:NAD-dependent dehydratase [Deltaproteobacteria bacterium]